MNRKLDRRNARRARHIERRMRAIRKAGGSAYSRVFVRVIYEYGLIHRQHLTIAEVGAASGTTAKILLGHVPNSTVHVVDKWKYARGTQGHWSQAKHDAHYEACVDLSMLFYGRCRLHRTSTARFARSCSRQRLTFDAIGIDAGHDYESVRRDLVAYWRLLKRGGVLVCDDYLSTREKQLGDWGVRRAVDEFSELRGLEVRVLGRQAVLRKPRRGKVRQ